MTVTKIIDHITTQLQDVPGIAGIVLGGSRARGNNRPDSDIDIGIYYDEAAGFDLHALNNIAADLDDEHRENGSMAAAGLSFKAVMWILFFAM